MVCRTLKFVAIGLLLRSVAIFANSGDGERDNGGSRDENRDEDRNKEDADENDNAAADDDANYQSSNGYSLSFSEMLVMPQACIRWNGGHMIKYALYENTGQRQCHTNSVGTFLISIAHYMHAHFNHQALLYGQDFSLPWDAGYLNCVKLPQTMYSQESIYAKIGCDEHGSGTSLKLALHLYKDKYCSRSYNEDGAHRNGYKINGRWLNNNVSFKPDFYTCQSCTPETISNSFKRGADNWYDDDYINVQGKKKQYNNGEKNNGYYSGYYYRPYNNNENENGENGENGEDEYDYGYAENDDLNNEEENDNDDMEDDENGGEDGDQNDADDVYYDDASYFAANDDNKVAYYDYYDANEDEDEEDNDADDADDADQEAENYYGANEDADDAVQDEDDQGEAQYYEADDVVQDADDVVQNEDEEEDAQYYEEEKNDDANEARYYAEEGDDERNAREEEYYVDEAGDDNANNVEEIQYYQYYPAEEEDSNDEQEEYYVAEGEEEQYYGDAEEQNSEDDVEQYYANANNVEEMQYYPAEEEDSEDDDVEQQYYAAAEENAIEGDDAAQNAEEEGAANDDGFENGEEEEEANEYYEGDDGNNAENDDQGRKLKVMSPPKALTLYQQRFWNDIKSRKLNQNNGSAANGWNFCQRLHHYGVWCDEDCQKITQFHVDQWSDSDLILLVTMCVFIGVMMLLVFAKRVKSYEKAIIYGEDLDAPHPGLPPIAMASLFAVILATIMIMASMKFVNETLMFAVVMCILLFCYMLKLTFFDNSYDKEPQVMHESMSKKLFDTGVV